MSDALTRDDFIDAAARVSTALLAAGYDCHGCYGAHSMHVVVVRHANATNRAEVTRIARKAADPCYPDVRLLDRSYFRIALQGDREALLAQEQLDRKGGHAWHIKADGSLGARGDKDTVQIGLLSAADPYGDE